MTEKLLECPFCGGRAERYKNPLSSEWTMVNCIQCGASAFDQKWNRRHSNEPAWTDRLAHVQKWTPIEHQCAELKDAIESLGAHLLITDALNAVDLAMRTLGKWHDDGEPGGRKTDG